VKITEWSSSLDRSNQKDSNKIYFAFFKDSTNSYKFWKSEQIYKNI
jgi:hypothetical protein